MTYSRTILTLASKGSKYEVKVTETGIYWAVYKDGAKITDFMNCQGSSAPMLCQAKLKTLGVDWYSDRVA